jgi:hypothetical protein
MDIHPDNSVALEATRSKRPVHIADGIIEFVYVGVAVAGGDDSGEPCRATIELDRTDKRAACSPIFRKETRLAGRHSLITFVILVHNSKHLMKEVKRRAMDIVAWSRIAKDDLTEAFKEICYWCALKDAFSIPIKARRYR